MKYKEYKEENKAYNKINGTFTFIAYVLRWRKVEALIALVVILGSVIVLQYLGFNFAFWK